MIRAPQIPRRRVEEGARQPAAGQAVKDKHRGTGSRAVVRHADPPPVREDEVVGVRVLLCFPCLELLGKRLFTGGVHGCCVCGQ